MFTSIKENLIPIYNLNEDIDILELKNDLNPFLQLCLCCICNKIPQTPVSLKRCKHLFCFLCIVEKIKFKYLDETFCPKCNKKVFYDDLFTSKQTDSLLRMLTIVCSFCNSKFNLLKEYELYKSHKGICLKEASVPQSFAASISVNDVFKINENSDIPYEVEKAALHVIKQKMAKFGGKSVEFKSGGPRPIVFTQTPKAYVNSAQAAESTLRLRNTNILKHFETVAGISCDSSISQTSKLLLSFEPDQRQSILSNTKLNHTKISANVMVAMKTDMGIPWEKLKVMSRWLKKYDITTASNASQRVVAENWSGNDIIVENAPFTFKKEQKGKIEINEVPWGYIADLPKHIFTHLEQLESCNSLVYHKFIPQKEIKIKIGGDYGGRSFKMCYQVVITLNPNSTENTIVFNIFESKDLRVNIKVGMTRFQKQIEDLQTMKYRGNNIRVFIFGDYEFLCALYGISGASGMLFYYFIQYI
ncbi:uncharacterized protein LOC124813329 isoform X3 [Hydra vulgaris]|uniref:uncharacterized protein LOC124813329 isoform X3 n=1 Tax=Hydra vulgaris TaxID=6087 RepID=UPI001F5FD867|nr:uncharacterized protein LOC124813329 isoform X2 [Hydra vulgaris]